MTRAFVLVALVGVGVGCGGASGGALDCAFLASDNCWKMTADDAASCLPPTTEQGTLSADKKTCTYPGGQTVTFTPAIVLPIPSNADWNFTIKGSGGADCLHFENRDSGAMKLTVNGNTVTVGSAGGFGLSITCPDGKSYSNANAFNLFDCNADAGVSLGGLPGNFWSDSSTSISVGLLGASSSLPLFHCVTP